MVSFIPLKLTSSYSLLESMLKTDDIIRLCRHHRLPAFAVTDHANLYGAMELSIKALKAGIQPITACSLGVIMHDGAPSHRISLYVQNEQGWRNLIQLVTLAHKAHIVDGQDATAVTWKQLCEHHEGLLLLSGGREGALVSLLAKGNIPAAAAWVQQCQQLFGNRFYLELNRHGYEEERLAEPHILSLAQRHGIPVVACHQACYETKDDVTAHEVLHCIAHKTTVGKNIHDTRPVHVFPDDPLMTRQFADYPETMHQSVLIAKRCSWFLREEKNPRMPVVGDETQLRAAANEGLAKHIAHIKDATQRQHYQKRLDDELEIIIRENYSGYMLILAEFMNWARAHDVPVGPGRGSGAGSLVAWALGVIDIDPLPLGLLFERFLNPERISMPDIDVDFCRDGRDRVIDHVREKYGSAQVAHIITFGALKCRAAIRDVGRALGYSYGQVDAIVRHFPNGPEDTIASGLKNDSNLRDMIKKDDEAGHIVSIARKVEGLYRHVSTHAAGVVIGDKPLDELVPLSFDQEKKTVLTQWSMKLVEKAGLVKFDFLGLKTLTMLRYAGDLLAAEGITVDFITLPLDDKATYQLLARGDTTGVFQLEGSGMRGMLKQLKPDCFEDVIAAVALYRPGPMQHIPEFVERKHGRKKVTYVDERLRKLLESTYGIIVYQEQVMKMAQILAGFSLGKADILRRAMGKKDSAEMASQKDEFIKGAIENGMKSDKAEKIFDLIAEFASYGFNKSHAAAYAMVAYQTAWLKAHHTEVFFAASMSIDVDVPEKCAEFYQEADEAAINFLPPSINHSEALFTVRQNDDGKNLVYGLAALRHVGLEAAKHIAQERKENGAYQSLFDFLSRHSPHVLNKRLLESLIKAGALDELIPSRRWGVENLDGWILSMQQCHKERQQQQANLFGEDGGQLLALQVPDHADEWDISEKLDYEKEILGFYQSEHPLSVFDEYMKRENMPILSEVMEQWQKETLEVRKKGKRVRCLMLINGFKKRYSKKTHEPFAFVSCWDRHNVHHEVAFFGDVFTKNRSLLDKPLRCEMGIELKPDQKNKEVTRVNVLSVKALPTQMSDAPPTQLEGQVLVRVTVDTMGELLQLQRMTENLPKGSDTLELILRETGDEFKRVRLPHRYRLGLVAITALRQICHKVDRERLF